MNNKGQGGVNLMSGIAIGVVTLVVILFIGFKIGQTLLDTESTAGVSDGTYSANATADLLGDSGLGLVRDLAPVMIIAVVGFGILSFFAFRRK